MSPIDALYHAVRNYPGGAEALAVRLGKRTNSLRHEVNPPQGSTAKAGVLDAITIMEMTGDLGCLDAMEAHFERVAFPLPRIESAAGDLLMAQVAEVAKEFGDVMAEVAASAADGRISDNELARVHRQWGELLNAGNKVLKQLGAMNAAGKPPRDAVALRQAAG